MPNADELFHVTLYGHDIACVSLEDAVAVKGADDILSGNDPTPYRSDYLARLAEVLARYGREAAAERLKQMIG